MKFFMYISLLVAVNGTRRYLPSRFIKFADEELMRHAEKLDEERNHKHRRKRGPLRKRKVVHVKAPEPKADKAPAATSAAKAAVAPSAPVVAQAPPAAPLAPAAVAAAPAAQKNVAAVAGAHVAAANHSNAAASSAGSSTRTVQLINMSNAVANASSTNRSRMTNATFECFTRRAKPKLTVVTVIVGLPDEYVSALRENRDLEGNRFGYEYCEFRHTLDPTRSLVWSKIRAIQELMARGRERIVWMDADAFVVNEKPFEDILDQYFDRGLDAVFTDDLPGAVDPVNIGVIAMKTSSWLQSFWEHVYTDFPFTWTHGMQEQQAVTNYRLRWRADFDAHAVIIKHEVMNNVGSRRGEFVAHVAGGDGKQHDKYWNLIEYLRSVNKHLIQQQGSTETVLAQGTMRSIKWNVLF